jgi:hypothetical protein
MKAKARHIAGTVWRYLSGDTNSPDVVEGVVKNADHLKACSCEMCRNPRRSRWYKGKEKRTRQERIAELNHREQAED